jgi:ABC-type phosphate transport system substrate-binding protein
METKARLSRPRSARGLARLVVLAATLPVLGVAASTTAWAGPTTVGTPSAATSAPILPAQPAVSSATSATSSASTGAMTTPPTAAGTDPSGPTPTTATDVVPRSGAVAELSTQLNGAGSSFAAPALENFTDSVRSAPYDLNVNYASTSSGDGRYEFAQQTTDFGASDIAYGLGSTDTQAPSFPFIYVPITAGGIAFMYNIPGLTKTLQLSSYTACALLTGGITNWNDPALAKDNPGVSLPNLTVRPVTESDSAGTNYVLEEWCIDEQPALWAAFANQENHQSGGPSDGVAISATAPESNWPGLPGGLDQQSTSGVAGNVATNPGAIGAVQVKYASDLGFGPNTPPKGVASVLNASGKYTQPTPVDVASALAYATQLDNGTHQLDFNGIGPNVYNPSTYSYLLAKTTGEPTAKGAVLSGYVNYALTLGQEASPTFGYASLGLSLEQYGVKAVLADVPGAVPVTAAEDKAYACGDLTPSEVAAGQTTPTCGVTLATAPPPGTNGGHSVGGSATSATNATAAAAGASRGVAAGSGSGSGSGSGVDPAVSLSGGTGLAFTGGDPLPLVVVGAALVVGAWFMRRRLLRRRTSGGVK